MELILSVLSHIVAAFYMAKPRCHKSVHILAWHGYAIVSSLMIILLKNEVATFFGLLILQVVILCAVSEGTLGEKLFLAFTYANSFSICIGMKLFLDVFIGDYPIYVALLLVVMHLFLYRVVIPVYRSGRIYFRDGWWKLCPLLVLFFIQFINQYAFTVTNQYSAMKKLFSFIVFAAIFYSTLFVIFLTVKVTAEKNRQMLVNDELKNIAYIDKLTGLQNRTAYLKYTKGKTIRHRNDLKMKCTIAALDIDGFKAINDTFGHAEGDRILSEVGAMMKSKFLPLQCATFRTGGDEFVVLSEDLSVNELEEAMEAFNETLHETIDTTISFGVENVDFTAVRPFDAAFEQADKKMYENKQQKKGAIFDNCAQEVLQSL